MMQMERVDLSYQDVNCWSDWVTSRSQRKLLLFSECSGERNMLKYLVLFDCNSLIPGVEALTTSPGGSHGTLRWFTGSRCRGFNLRKLKRPQPISHLMWFSTLVLESFQKWTYLDIFGLVNCCSLPGLVDSAENRGSTLMTDVFRR